MDHTTAFREAILSHGWDPGPVYPDGRLHRFSEPERRNKTCWYVLHDMGTFAAGVFGNWREGTSHKWTSRNGTGLSEDERRAWQGKQAEIEARQKSAQAKAKERAAFIWSHAAPAPADHGYLIKKGIKPHIARLYKGVLAIPVKNEGELVSAQLISPDGTKRFIKGGRTKGGYCEIPGTGIPILGEGYASLASANEATGAPGFVAFSCGNLEPVAEMLVKKYGPNFVIVADNDAFTHKPDGTPWNPGKEKALALAWRLNLKVALPTFENTESKPTDFNDLATLSGPETVKTQIDAAMLPKDWLLKECSENGPGAAYRPENLEGLRLLKERDPAGYRDLREQLRRLRAGITDLDKALAKPQGARQEGLSHLKLAEKALSTFGAGNVIFTQGYFWAWTGAGVWHIAHDRELKERIQENTKGLQGITRAAVDSILDMAKTAAFRARHEWDVGAEGVNCKNGELIWDGTEWTLRPHAREHYRTAQIPVAYDPAAEAPRFGRFLEEVFEGEPDAEERAILVCECIGYTLLTTCCYEKFILLIGPGANGKSVLMETVAALVGRENTCAVQPSHFENRFQRAHLHNKLANLVSEIAEGAEIHDAQLKAIVSGELTTAEHKHRDPFDFRPFATCWFGTNHMPHTRDFSNALFRRALVIPFNRTFREPEQDRALTRKLRPELAGIINLALEGIAGVFTRGCFTEPASSVKAKEEWRLNADQVQQFAQDECLFDSSARTPVPRLFEAYLEWAKTVGVKRTVGRNTFGDRICRLGAERDKGTGGARVLCGVTLKHQMG